MVLGDLVAYRVKSSLDSFLSKSFVERGEPLPSPVEQKVTPQKPDSYISLNLHLNRSTRWQTTLPVLTMATSHGHRLFREG
jgi:hypothetical protein